MSLLSKSLKSFGAALTAALALAGCGGGSSSTGTLSLSLTDAPSCGYDSVKVVIEKIRVHQSGTANPNNPSGWTDLTLPGGSQTFDLLTLQNGVLADLGQIPLQTGNYQQMRLVLATSGHKVTPSSTHAEVDLTAPSGAQTGIKMNVDIAIAADKMADFVIDFDACKSVVPAGGRYLLKPVVKVIPNYISGVKGYVDTTLANGNTLVTLQQGGVVVRATSPDAAGLFVLPVAPGTYDMVMTAAGRVSAVVSGVEVTTETVTAINTSTTQLNPDDATSAPATGTASGKLTTTVSPNDGVVRALQALTGGPTVEIASQPVDADTGDYSFSLPVDAPQRADYVSGSTLIFTSDTSAAGKYSLEASSNGATKTSGPFTLSSGGTVTNDFSFP